LAGRTVRDIGHPGLVRSCGGKGLRQYVFLDRQRMRRIRGRREPADLGTAQAQFLPQPLDAPDSGGEPVRAQFGLQPFRTIRLAGPHMGGLNRHFQPRILLGSCRGEASAPGIIPASGHVKDPTQLGYTAYYGRTRQVNRELRLMFEEWFSGLR